LPGLGGVGGQDGDWSGPGVDVFGHQPERWDLRGGVWQGDLLRCQCHLLGVAAVLKSPRPGHFIKQRRPGWYAASSKEVTQARGRVTPRWPWYLPPRSL